MEKHSFTEGHSEPKTKKRAADEAFHTSDDVTSLAEIGSNLKKWGKAHPAEAALIGLGVGFLVGVALRKTLTRSE